MVMRFLNDIEGDVAEMNKIKEEEEEEEALRFHKKLRNWVLLKTYKQLMQV
jgi:hypothetical protein